MELHTTWTIFLLSCTYMQKTTRGVIASEKEATFMQEEMKCHQRIRALSQKWEKNRIIYYIHIYHTYIDLWANIFKIECMIVERKWGLFEWICLYVIYMYVWVCVFVGADGTDVLKSVSGRIFVIRRRHQIILLLFFRLLSFSLWNTRHQRQTQTQHNI